MKITVTRNNMFKPSSIAIFIATALIAVIAAFPLYWMINTALLPTKERFQATPKLFPALNHSAGFDHLFSQMAILQWLSNTAFVAIGCTLTSLALGIFAAYAISRRHFKGRGLVTFILFATQMLPEALLVIPLYTLFVKLGLIDNLFGLVLVNAAFVMPITVWVLKGAIDTIPVELEEAAVIDGCTVFQIQRLIIWPLIAPSIVASAVMAFFQSWNEYLYATTFILEPSKRLASTGLAGLIGELVTPLDRVMAASVLYTLPPLIFFLLVQKRIVAGLTSGGVKG
jgi:multiple sugar transport system permease protein